MIELTCQTCAEKVGVQSLLAAAQQSCLRCGHLLMGPLDRSSRVARPSSPEQLRTQSFADGGRGRGGVWAGVFVGGCIGVGAVVALTQLGSSLPQNVRGGVLGALSGVLLSPVMLIASFLLMIVPPFKWIDVFAMVSDSAWDRMSRAFIQGKLRHLVFPVLLFLVLPMAACGYGGAKMNPNELQISAGLGALLLGAIVGGVCGARSRGR
jgi:hypothetical protein